MTALRVAMLSLFVFSLNAGCGEVQHPPSTPSTPEQDIGANRRGLEEFLIHEHTDVAFVGTYISCDKWVDFE